MLYWNLGKTFLDISSTNIDTLVPSLYQCVETRSKEVFLLLSQLLPHLRFNLVVISEKFATKGELLYVTNTSHVNRKHFFTNILCIDFAKKTQ
jgi:hypothetical protein